MLCVKLIKAFYLVRIDHINQDYKHSININIYQLLKKLDDPFGKKLVYIYELD